jgi:prepilin-type N-terminal cleavage/methylation domain-containing protein
MFMKHYATKHTREEQGFTLVETLVAIAILLLIIIGPITAAQKGIQQAYYANEQLSAVFLAQEAIEAIRQRRDDRALEAWNNPSGNVDTSTWSTAGCSGSSGPLTCSVTKDGLTYNRTITIGAGGSERPVTVTVSWTNTSLFGGATRSVVLQTYLHDHYRRFGQ